MIASPHRERGVILKPFDDILSAVMGVGSVVSTGQGMMTLMKSVKPLLMEAESKTIAVDTLPRKRRARQAIVMETFRSQIDDPYEGGAPWMPRFQDIAARQGNPWVPRRNEGFMGINLTGIWCPANNRHNQAYVKQFGPYLNIIAGIDGLAAQCTEGLFNPATGAIVCVGLNDPGLQVQIQGQALPNWTIQGVITLYDGSLPVQQNPLWIMRVG